MDDNLMFYSREDGRAFTSMKEYNEYRAKKAEEKCKAEEEASQEKARQEALKAEKETFLAEIQNKYSDLMKLVQQYNTKYVHPTWKTYYLGSPTEFWMERLLI